MSWTAPSGSPKPPGARNRVGIPRCTTPRDYLIRMRKRRIPVFLISCSKSSRHFEWHLYSFDTLSNTKEGPDPGYQNHSRGAAGEGGRGRDLPQQVRQAPQQVPHGGRTEARPGRRVRPAVQRLAAAPGLGPEGGGRYTATPRPPIPENIGSLGHRRDRVQTSRPGWGRIKKMRGVDSQTVCSGERIAGRCIGTTK